MRLPVFCDTCGTIFPSPMDIRGGGTVVFSGVKSPCPVCGGYGRILDGAFSFVGDAIKVLSDSQQTFADLSRLKTMLDEAREKKEEPEVTTKKVRELFPALFNMLPSDPSLRAAYIGITLTLITMIQNSCDTPENINVSNITNQTFNQIYIEMDKDKASKLQPKQEQSKKDVGRNELCPCGSGKKYKNCCGMI